MSIFLALFPNSFILLFAFWFFLFRFMFSSGMVKILSGDSHWRDLSAMTLHYETQPLPNRLGRRMHFLPEWFQKFSCATMFAIEIGVPFLIFGPEPLRLFACASLIILQILIFATGSYCFFNILTVSLCLLLIGDNLWISLAGEEVTILGTTSFSWLGDVLGAIFILLNILQILRLFNIKTPFQIFVAALAPFGISNGYGLFAVMTTKRYELILEGSNDGQQWLAYEFKFKPGNLARAPRQAAPHQPRLDWQMWFAALRPFGIDAWLASFLNKVEQGEKSVLALLDNNPFPDESPKFLRLAIYDYHFTSQEEKKLTGNFWKRELIGYAWSSN